MMVDYIFTYLEDREVYASSAAEQAQLETAIRQFLHDNGIGENQTGTYYRQYVQRQLERIDTEDLKSYFCAYPKIREIRQILVESRESVLPISRRKQLCALLETLHCMGLGDKYVPAVEIKLLLGRMV
ncbi:MAG: hypothetical protein IJ480_09850 [Clostridia bacterium]|nr:hypothetical protein [Clostridia bacterium]